MAKPTIRSYMQCASGALLASSIGKNKDDAVCVTVKIKEKEHKPHQNTRTISVQTIRLCLNEVTFIQHTLVEVWNGMQLLLCLYYHHK